MKNKFYFAQQAIHALAEMVLNTRTSKVDVRLSNLKKFLFKKTMLAEKFWETSMGKTFILVMGLGLGKKFVDTYCRLKELVV